MAEPALPPHIAALLAPEAYSHKADRVELRQTHISYVFLAGDFVYKIKKPLDLGFLDYSTLEKRKRCCEQEVRLNRRLCHGTYLGVVPIARDGGSLKMEGRGEPIEYAVKMRRLPDEGMMSHLLERGALTAPMLADLARRLADFHASSARSDDIDRFAGLETALLNWRENFEQTEPYLGRTISRPQFEEIRAFVENTAESDAELFAERVREGRARDCHGDLRADAVCFTPDHVCVYDCIEFNDRFRYSDVAADIAFLAMDLEFRRRQDLSDELMGRYLGYTLDSTLPLLLPFYKCYRAYVRGKVDGFQLDQPEIDAEQKKGVRAGARRYFELAHDYATHITPRLLLVTVGVTGSGKSYLANPLAARLGAAVFSSDATRKRLLGIAPTESRIEPFETGSYSREMTQETYTALLEAARTWLERDKPVILDATFLARAHREAALLLALKTETPVVVLECEADEALIWQRLSERRGSERVVSDGRWEIYRAQQEGREPVDELPVGSHIVIDTSWPLRDQLTAVVTHLGLRPEGVTRT